MWSACNMWLFLATVFCPEKNFSKTDFSFDWIWDETSHSCLFLDSELFTRVIFNLFPCYLFIFTSCVGNAMLLHGRELDNCFVLWYLMDAKGRFTVVFITPFTKVVEEESPFQHLLYWKQCMFCWFSNKRIWGFECGQALLEGYQRLLWLSFPSTV